MTDLDGTHRAGHRRCERYRRGLRAGAGVAGRRVTVADVDEVAAKAIAERDQRKGLGGRPSRCLRA